MELLSILVLELPRDSPDILIVVALIIARRLYAAAIFAVYCTDYAVWADVLLK